MPGKDEVGVMREGAVAIVEMRSPPHNFFSNSLISALADAMEALDRDADCRAIVLAAQGTAFSAGANFGGRPESGMVTDPSSPGALYAEAVRLFRVTKPIVAAVHGSAVGGGLGLAMMPDFRVTCREAKFCANFSRLGTHPGFGLSIVLPRLIGQQRAALMMYTGRRFGGEEAVAMGLADQLVPREQVRSAAIAMAAEIAISAPIAVVSTRQTLRGQLAEQVRLATTHESAEQRRLSATEDFKEGVAAMQDRRTPVFHGR